MNPLQLDHSSIPFKHDWLTEPAVLTVYVKGQSALRVTGTCGCPRVSWGSRCSIPPVIREEKITREPSTYPVIVCDAGVRLLV